MGRRWKGKIRMRRIRGQMRGKNRENLSTFCEGMLTMTFGLTLARETLTLNTDFYHGDVIVAFTFGLRQAREAKANQTARAEGD